MNHPISHGADERHRYFVWHESDNLGYEFLTSPSEPALSSHKKPVNNLSMITKSYSPRFNGSDIPQPTCRSCCTSLSDGRWRESEEERRLHQDA